MKLKDRIKRSFSSQVVYLFGLSIFFLILGTVILFYIQNEFNDKYIEEREKIVHERNLLIKINDLFNATFVDTMSLTTLDDPQKKIQLYSQEEEIDRLTIQLESSLGIYGIEEIDSDKIREFSNHFFINLLPSYIEVYENGDEQKLDEFNDTTLVPEIKSFQVSMITSIMDVGKQLESNVTKLSKNQTYIQMIFTAFIVIFLYFLQRIIKRIFKNIGDPLTEFAIAANEIAAGKDAVIQTYPERKDELGTLSVAFQKMVTILQIKEQDLIAHNEELMAQQEELQAGQDQLQETLGILLENEKKIMNQNELINGISSSLDKKEVLDSIVLNMCKITFSDCGMIALVHEDYCASLGISNTGAKQFKNNLDSALNQRLMDTKKAFVIKREQNVSEKGYHEFESYSYDLYLPVLNNSKKVVAIMVYTRFGYSYSDKEIEDYETLTKQIAISLDKIKLYERSEEARTINQDIISTVDEGIQLIDENRNIIQVNHQLFDMLDSTLIENDVLGLSWSDWSASMAEKIEGKQFIANLDKAIGAASRGDDEKCTFIYQLKGGTHVFQLYCKQIVNGGKAAGTIIVHRDITKEYEVDQMKSEFVSTVSHELRTPLASVLGFTELLLHKELKPERKTKYLNTIYNEAKRLSALINDFLDIQRMESGKQSYDKKYIDIRPIWGNVIENQQVQTLNHQIHLSVDTEQTRILGDKEKIQQVFTNVLSNAIKYSPKGGNVFIHLHEDEHSLIIDVKDEGLGIPNEAIPHLFEKFYRVDNTDHRQIGGTGLGLSIVSEIVKIHDGKITVDSQVGVGSIFTLTFPKIIMKKQFASDKNASPTIHHDVVIVEDDLSLADLLFQELTGSGFQVSCFNHGQAALNHMRSFPPDAIVLDIKLEENEIDGWTIMDELKKDDTLKDIPIFISSAFDEKERGYSLGAQDYLVKPYSPSKLSKVIMQTLLENGKQAKL